MIDFFFPQKGHRSKRVHVRNRLAVCRLNDDIKWSVWVRGGFWLINVLLLDPSLKGQGARNKLLSSVKQRQHKTLKGCSQFDLRHHLSLGESWTQTHTCTYNQLLLCSLSLYLSVFFFSPVFPFSFVWVSAKCLFRHMDLNGISNLSTITWISLVS